MFRSLVLFLLLEASKAQNWLLVEVNGSVVWSAPKGLGTSGWVSAQTDPFKLGSRASALSFATRSGGRVCFEDVKLLPLVAPPPAVPLVALWTGMLGVQVRAAPHGEVLIPSTSRFESPPGSSKFHPVAAKPARGKARCFCRCTCEHRHSNRSAVWIGGPVHRECHLPAPDGGGRAQPVHQPTHQRELHAVFGRIHICRERRAARVSEK